MPAAPPVLSPVSDAYRRIREAIGTQIVGLGEALELTLIGIFTEGHVLLIGVPGLAKTLLISSLSRLLDLRFSRIQFTPDLMPSDITGGELLVQDQRSRERTFRFAPGPIFAHVLLADEINRAPPKTQAALLEAMEERQVTSVGKRYPLERPFFVLATQNPIEQEGTYPLPAAQQDRFMFNVRIGYPSDEEERRVVRLTTSAPPAALQSILTREQILEAIAAVDRVPAPEGVLHTAMDLARRTRPKEPGAPDYVRDWVAWGAGPRAAQFLVRGARARALIHGRDAATIEDVQFLAGPVLRHRILTNYRAEAEGIAADDIVRRLLGLPEGADRPRNEGLLQRLRALFARRRA
jgi:MoxR-like ATPase